MRLASTGRWRRRSSKSYFDGYHPRTGQPLAQNHGKEDRRAALDICYSVPKDVSALWAAADEPERRRIEKALEKAVTEALNYLSDNFGYTRKGHGGYEREKVDLLVAEIRPPPIARPGPAITCSLPSFEHGAAALGRAILDCRPGAAPSTKKLGGAVFRSALARELGIPLEADRFSFRVPGVPQDLSEYWSSRAQEIERAAKERGLGGARAKEQIALETRRAKDERPLVEMKDEMARDRPPARVYRGGGGRQSFASAARSSRPSRRPRSSMPRSKNRRPPHEPAGPLHAEMDIVRDVCIATVTHGIAPREIHERVEETLRGERFLSLGRHRDQERFTTREIFHETEARALEAAEKLSLQAAPCHPRQGRRGGHCR